MTQTRLLLYMTYGKTRLILVDQTVMQTRTAFYINKALNVDISGGQSNSRRMSIHIQYIFNAKWANSGNW